MPRLAGLIETASRQRYLVHEWDDGVAVFDLATGDTHVLDKTLAEYFRAHQEGRDSDDAATVAARARLSQMDLLG